MNYDLILYVSKLGYPDAAEAEEMQQDAINSDDLGSNSFDDPDMTGGAIDVPCAPILDQMTRELGTDDPEVASESWITLHLPYGSKGADAVDLFSRTNEFLKRFADYGYYVYDVQAGKAFDPQETDFDWVDMYEKGAEMMEEIKSEDFGF